MGDTAHKTDREYVEHFDPEEELDKKITQFAQWVRESKHFIAFTGAGISTSAGIADFRSGLNTALPTGAGTWTLAAAKQERTAKTVAPVRAVPTEAHMALVELMTGEKKYLKHLISQNTDGLHRRSGIPSEQLSELHGNGNIENCRDCGHQYLRDFRVRTAKGTKSHETGRHCVAVNAKTGAVCGGALHDTIINFGEDLPAKPMAKGFEEADEADLCVVLGSSLRVTPAADMPEAVAKRKQRLVIVNLQETPLDWRAAMRINATIDVVMSRLMTKLELTIPPFKLVRHLNVVVHFTPTAPALPEPDNAQPEAKGAAARTAAVGAAATANPKKKKKSAQKKAGPLTPPSAATAAAAAASTYLSLRINGVEPDGTPATLFKAVDTELVGPFTHIQTTKAEPFVVTAKLTPAKATAAATATASATTASAPAVASATTASGKPSAPLTSSGSGSGSGSGGSSANTGSGSGGSGGSAAVADSKSSPAGDASGNTAGHGADACAKLQLHLMGNYNEPPLALVVPLQQLMNHATTAATGTAAAPVTLHYRLTYDPADRVWAKPLWLNPSATAVASTDSKDSKAAPAKTATAATATATAAAPATTTTATAESTDADDKSKWQKPSLTSKIGAALSKLAYPVYK